MHLFGKADVALRSAAGRTLSGLATTTECSLPLCQTRVLEERGKAWVWDVLEYARPARAFALRVDGVVRAYMNRCVHVPAEMDWQPGEFLDIDRRYIMCSIHGATYEPSDGRCVGGPCGRGRLTAIRTDEKDGMVYWYPSPAIRPVVVDEPAEPRAE